MPIPNQKRIVPVTTAWTILNATVFGGPLDLSNRGGRPSPLH
ncbi:MAG: hypothetical protein ACJ71R_17870 [Nitrososphaeraceae archaeon]